MMMVKTAIAKDAIDPDKWLSTYTDELDVN